MDTAVTALMPPNSPQARVTWSSPLTCFKLTRGAEYMMGESLVEPGRMLGKVRV